MNLGTVREKIKLSSNQRSAEADWHIHRAIEAAILHYHRKVFRFNEATATIELGGAETSRLPNPSSPDQPFPTPPGFPWDLLRINDLRTPGSPYALQQMNVRTLRTRYPDNAVGSPRAYAMVGDKTLLVRPTVGEGYEMDCFYVQDIGVPRMTLENGVWVARVDGAQIDDTYTNAWFDEAQTLIAQHALAFLHMNVWGDTEKAQRAKVLEREALKSLESFDRMTDDTTPAEPWH